MLPSLMCWVRVIFSCEGALVWQMSGSLNFCLLLSHRSQMNAGLCVCVVLAVLCASCLGLPFSSQPLDEGQRPISALSEGKSCDTFLAITVSFCAWLVLFLPVLSSSPWGWHPHLGRSPPPTQALCPPAESSSSGWGGCRLPGQSQWAAR